MKEEERIEKIIYETIDDVVLRAALVAKNAGTDLSSYVGSIVDNEIKPAYSRLLAHEAQKGEADFFEGLPIFMKLAESALAIVFFYQFINHVKEEAQ